MQSSSPAFEYVFPAIRGVQARREFYVSMVPLRMVSKVFSFNEDGKGGKIRFVPVHPHSSQRISEYLERSEHGAKSDNALFRPVKNPSGTLEKALTGHGKRKAAKKKPVSKGAKKWTAALKQRKKLGLPPQSSARSEDAHTPSLPKSLRHDDPASERQSVYQRLTRCKSSRKDGADRGD